MSIVTCHKSYVNGSKVTAILLKGWISPIGGASAVEGQRSTGLPRLVTRYPNTLFQLQPLFKNKLEGMARYVAFL